MRLIPHHHTLKPTARNLHNIAPNAPKSVAILGGGITGLSAAWYLTKLAPTLPITIYEKSPRLGGWLNTKRIQTECGTVKFESGPRTIRPWTVAGLVTIDLIRQLGLEPELKLTPKTSPAATNRFIYYPDRLNQLPASAISALLSSLTMPVMKGVISGLLAEPFVKRRSEDVVDESVGGFLRRRLGNGHVVDNLVSAVVHGVYAGDVDRLSVKSVFPALWIAEGLHGSVLRGLLVGGWRGTVMEREGDRAIREELEADNTEICKSMEGTSVYSFRNGIETLVSALARHLGNKPNVTIKTGSTVSRVEYVENQHLPVQITESLTGHRPTFSHAISTLLAPTLASLLPAQSPSPSLAAIRAATVQVTNLHYKSPTILPVQGFGYLLPKSLCNPEQALGVIFDSTTPSGTTLTVMAGGHYWASVKCYPPPSVAVADARAVLKRHLGVTDDPVLTDVSLQRDCIPQYDVGHEERLCRARGELGRGFRGRLSVAGSSYAGVGVNDCVRSARDVAAGVWRMGYATGLEKVGVEGWVERGRNK